MKATIASNILAFAALTAIFTTTVAAAAAMPAAIQRSYINPTDPVSCTVYYMPLGGILNVRGRVKPVNVLLNEDNRGYHAFKSPLTIYLAFTLDCPAEVSCIFEINYGIRQSSPFGGSRTLLDSVENATAVKCGPLTDFGGREFGNGSDVHTEENVRDRTVRPLKKDVTRKNN